MLSATVLFAVLFHIHRHRQLAAISRLISRYIVVIVVEVGALYSQLTTSKQRNLKLDSSIAQRGSELQHLQLVRYGS